MLCVVILLNIIFFCAIANRGMINIVPANNVLLPQDGLIEN